MRKCNLLWAALDAFGARYMYPFRAPNDRDAAEHKAGTLEPPLVHEVSALGARRRGPSGPGSPFRATRRTWRHYCSSRGRNVGPWADPARQDPASQDQASQDQVSVAWDAVCAKMERDDYKRFSVQFRNDVNRLQVRRRPPRGLQAGPPGARWRRSTPPGRDLWDIRLGLRPPARHASGAQSRCRPA